MHCQTFARVIQHSAKSDQAAASVMDKHKDIMVRWREEVLAWEQ